MNKYRRGDDRQFYLQCWNGGRYRVDRKGNDGKGGGITFVEDLFLSVVGTIQPSIAEKVFRGGDVDGMIARFGLIAWPNQPDRVDVIDRRPNYDIANEIEQRLREMRSVPPDVLGVKRGAYEIFRDWLLTNENRPERRDDSPFAAHLAKYPGLFVRLSLVFHFMNQGSNSGTLRAFGTFVDEATMEAVRAFIDDYLEPHARRIYGVLGAHPGRAGALRIARWIKDSKVREFTVRDIRQREWSVFKVVKDEAAIAEALNYLEAQGWIKLQAKAPGPKGGRPTLTATVNPAVAGL